MTTDELNGLKRLIERMMGYYSIPGCAMAVIDGEDTYYLHFGLRDVEAGAAFDGNTVSGIGSCSKSMTAAAALRLADKGVLDIDAPIASYVPGFALWDEHASAMVTLRDLLCHRTGVAGHDGAWPDNSISRTDFLRRLKYLEPNAPFRTVAQYSNTMYAAAGGVMEAVTGRKWEDILREEIFEPLGMTHTYCLMGDAEKETDLAVPYRWQEGLRRMARWNIDMAGPCGSVMSTAWDMAKWLAFHIRGGMAGDRALLTPSRFLDMHTPQILMDYPHVRGGRSLGYGLGWRVMEYHGHIVQQHTGKIEGYSAFQFYLPGSGKGAVYLQNLHAPDNPFIFAVQGYLLDAFTGRPEDDWYAVYTEKKRDHAPEDMYHHLEHDYMPAETIPGTAPSHPAADYTGVYENPGYGLFRVREEAGRLVLDERAVAGLPLTHVHYDTFRVEGIKEDTDLYTLPLTFFSEADGKIGGFTLMLEPKVAPVRFRKVQ